MTTRRSGSGVFLVIVAALCALAATSCGIQDVPFYYPPTLTDWDESANTFRLVHNILNYDSLSAIQYFVGYEMYYRAYTSSGEAESAIAAMQSEIDRTDGSPALAFSKLETLGFKRVYNADDTSNPYDDRPILKDFVASSANYFTVYLKGSEDWYYTANGADPDVTTNRHYLRRYPSGSTTSQPFYLKTGYLAGNVDYAGSYSSPDTLYFVFYGVAYGQDSQSPLTVIPSYPNYTTSYFTFIPN